MDKSLHVIQASTVQFATRLSRDEPGLTSGEVPLVDGNKDYNEPGKNLFLPFFRYVIQGCKGPFTPTAFALRFVKSD